MPILYTHGVKVYSWNMFHRNADLQHAFDFISKVDFDIFCLQEVPEKFLSKLATLPYSIVHGIDVDIVGAGTGEGAGVAGGGGGGSPVT